MVVRTSQQCSFGGAGVWADRARRGFSFSDGAAGVGCVSFGAGIGVLSPLESVTHAGGRGSHPSLMAQVRNRGLAVWVFGGGCRLWLRSKFLEK